jgi:putative glycosyltransferase (TIGR04372 family)
MVIANCISPDAQVWGDNVDFLLKRIYDRAAKRYLTLAEIYRQPVRGLLINGIRLKRNGLEAHENKPTEIAEAVREKLDRLDGHARPVSPQLELLSASYREFQRQHPYLFGAAMPASAFLHASPEILEA